MKTFEQQTAQVVKIFVSSPSDVMGEREVLDEVVKNYNMFSGQRDSVVLQVFRWEKSVIPRLGDGPQPTVDQQTPNYEIYLGIFKQRFGTPTDAFGSGTEEELRSALAIYNSKKKMPWVMLYFSTEPVNLKTMDEHKQYGKVMQLKSQVEDMGIIGTYKEVRGNSEGFFEQLTNCLPMIVESILKEQAGQAVKKAEELKNAVTQGVGSPPLASFDCGRIKGLVPDLRRPILDVIGPTYLLDKNYYFMDWNPIFDLLLAKPLGLSRGDHGIDLIKNLSNCDTVIERSKTVFNPQKDPIVDTEPLHFKSPDYGLIKFQKIATLINCVNNEQSAWAVNLNILDAESSEQLWEDIERNLRNTVNWSRYASSYDKLLEPFDDYQQLLELIAQKVGASAYCVDLGAGTGNGTLRLLNSSCDRKVWAVESNEEMIQLLMKKTAAHAERLTIIKDDIVRLGKLRHQKNQFDAAIMINVLYAINDPQQCLSHAFEILSPGGTLVLSTPHCGTDINRLLTQMRNVLMKKNIFNELATDFDNATLFHKQLETNILRDSPDDIQRYVEDAGFQIKDWHDKEYVDSVIVLKAIKPFVAREK